jgi:hypothetical protein
MQHHRFCWLDPYSLGSNPHFTWFKFGKLQFDLLNAKSYFCCLNPNLCWLDPAATPPRSQRAAVAPDAPL